jgi:succinoglycan biosynthesis protein ExoM
MTFISILIPTYCRLPLLSQVLKACLEQAASFGDSVEILIIDNSAGGSAASLVKALSFNSSTALRYVHEPRTGVATARNTAIHSARGKYVIFLDDDQLPGEGWLEAFYKAAECGVKAAFGPLIPRFEAPPAMYSGVLKRIFSRVIPAEDGEEVGSLYPYLGTGNSLFEKMCCFPDRDAFDVQFDVGGGEDVWMLKALHSRKVPFTWVSGAKVVEYVPTARMTFSYLSSRKFRSGQTRALLSLHPDRRRPAALLFWMAAGLVQAALNLSLFWLTWPVKRETAREFRIKASGGLGKLFWFLPLPLAPDIGHINEDR